MYRNIELILYKESDLLEKLDILNNFKQIEWAYILHDKDVGVKSHYHLRIFCKDKKSLSSWSKILNCEIHDIEILQYKKLSIRYLIHLDNKEKYQYDKEQIFSNFNLDHYLEIKIDEQMQVEKIISFILECDYFLYLKNVYIVIFQYRVFHNLKF